MDFNKLTILNCRYPPGTMVETVIIRGWLDPVTFKTKFPKIAKLFKPKSKPALVEQHALIQCICGTFDLVTYQQLYCSDGKICTNCRETDNIKMKKNAPLNYFRNRGSGMIENLEYGRKSYRQKLIDDGVASGKHSSYVQLLSESTQAAWTWWDDQTDKVRADPDYDFRDFFPELILPIRALKKQKEDKIILRKGRKKRARIDFKKTNPTPEELTAYDLKRKQNNKKQKAGMAKKIKLKALKIAENNARLKEFDRLNSLENNPTTNSKGIR